MNLCVLSFSEIKIRFFLDLKLIAYKNTSKNLEVLDYKV